MKTKCGWDDKPGGLLGCDSLILYGPTLIVHIGFDPAFDPTTGKPNIPADTRGALVDTGALASCIDSTLALQLNLPIVDRQPVSGAHGRREVNVHLAQVHVPSLKHTVYGQFFAVDLVAGGQPHFALIGRTFLRDFTMVYEGHSGTVTLEHAPDHAFSSAITQIP